MMPTLADSATWRSVNGAAYDRMALDYFRRSEGAGIEADAMRLVSSLISRFGSAPRVVDIGSGPGVDAWWLSDAGASPICIDVSASMLRTANDRSAPAVFVCGDMLKNPFISESFHGAWACASLLHAPKSGLPQALEEIHRILVRGGLLYLALRAGEGHLIASRGTSHARFLALYRESELETALVEAGLRPLALSQRKWPLALDDGFWIHGFAIRC